jgi:hypothetical protein
MLSRTIQELSIHPSAWKVHSQKSAYLLSNSYEWLTA